MKAAPLLIALLFGLVAPNMLVQPASADSVPCVGPDLAAGKAAQKDAKGTLDAAVNFLRGNDAKTKQLVMRWFGRNDQATIASVASVLSRTSDWVGRLSLYCLYANDGSWVEPVKKPDGAIVLEDEAGNLYAYVYPADLARITLALKFFKAPATGMNSRLGVIVHEVTHYFLTGNTDDIRYGIAACLKLAKEKPDSALKNADNYEYFIEEWLAS